MRTTDRLRNLNFRYYNYTLHGTYEGTQKKKRIKKKQNGSTYTAASSRHFYSLQKMTTKSNMTRSDPLTLSQPKKSILSLHTHITMGTTQPSIFGEPPRLRGPSPRINPAQHQPRVRIRLRRRILNIQNQNIIRLGRLMRV